jgi:hypothetical protein
MPRILLLFISTILFSSCYKQERNCTDFKNGKFRFDFVVNGKKQTTIFERKDSFEIETFNNKTDTSKIRWVNDCEYVLTKINPKTIQEKKSVAMRIITTTKDSYTFEFGLVGSDKKQKGTATKINL